MNTQAIIKPGLDVEKIKADFPILAQEVYGKPLTFLDTAASAQKPRAVIEAETALYELLRQHPPRGL